MSSLLSLQSLQIVVILLLATSSTVSCGDYPIPSLTRQRIPEHVFGTGFAINENYFMYGGQGRGSKIVNHFTKIHFDPYGVVHTEVVNSNGPYTSYPQSVVFSNNDSVAIIGGNYEGYNPNITDPIRAQVYSFSQNSWTALPGLDGTGPVPGHRQEHTAVKAANGLIYIHGGISSFDNFTLIRDNWSYDPTSGIFTNLATPPLALYGSTATALPYVDSQ